LILPIVAKLIELKCYENKLTELILPENNQLRIINVARNLLTDFAYANLNPATLKELKLRNNKLSASNISVLSQLVNLVVLEIGNQNK
jgi:hypothetical protein